MADRFYGVDLGQTLPTVTNSSSTTNKAVEVVVDLANSPTRIQVLEALEHLTNYITHSNWPPA